MAEDDGLIEGDMFDPATARLEDIAVAERTEQQQITVEQYLRRRQQAYASVFSNAPAEDIEFVMLDLAFFCRAYTSTYDDVPTRAALKEGRREVYNRIMDHTLLDHNTLFVKYNSSNPKIER